MKDILITWPKTRSFESYIVELINARRDGHVINYRIANPPRRADIERCYIVYDGRVIGWTTVISVTERKANQVKRVASDPLQGYWPAGWYIVRKPDFHKVKKQLYVTGFQGWRWFDRKSVGD